MIEFDANNASGQIAAAQCWCKLARIAQLITTRLLVPQTNPFFCAGESPDFHHSTRIEGLEYCHMIGKHELFELHHWQTNRNDFNLNAFQWNVYQIYDCTYVIMRIIDWNCLGHDFLASWWCPIPPLAIRSLENAIFILDFNIQYSIIDIDMDE